MLPNGNGLMITALLLTIVHPLQAFAWESSVGVTPLNHGWRFGGEYTPGSEDPKFDDSRFQEVTIPHVVAPLGWNEWDNNTWNKVWIYRNNFDLPFKHDKAKSLRTFLDFEGVLTITNPSINGHALPTHEGGYLPFSYEITDHVHERDNALAVVVDSRWSYVNPEGSPDGPVSIDYLEPGGIYREVSVRVEPPTFISDVFAKPINVLSSDREVVVEYTIDSAAPPGRVEVVCHLMDGRRTVSRNNQHIDISEHGTRTFKLRVPAPSVDLWSPDSPKLYQIVLDLLINGEQAHSFTRNIGFREAIFTTDGFFLNGERLQIFGLNRHQLFPYVGMAASERLQKRDAELLKDLNCNMVRCSHYPQSCHFLDKCDELGLMVWQEVPGWQFIGNETWKDHVVSDVREMIIRDRSRPSVIVWGTQVNESPLQPELYTKTKKLAKSLDDSRQCSGTETTQELDGWVADVFSYDDYHSTNTTANSDAYLLPPLTNVPYFISETVGGLSGPKFFRWIDDQDVQQAQAKLHAQVNNIAAGNQSYAGVLAWVGIDYDSYKDFQGNLYQSIKWTGVLDKFRVRKPGAAFYLAQSDARKEARIEPAFYWDFSNTSSVKTLGSSATIWSNCDMLKAYIGGKYYSTMHPDTKGFPNLAHPPFYLDVTGVDSKLEPDLRLDGYVSGRKVASRDFAGNTKGDHVQIGLDDKQLNADGIDSTLLSFRAVDRFGNPRPTVSGDTQLAIKGPAEWVNALPDGVFPTEENGGVGGALIRTFRGRKGLIEIRVTHPSLGHETVEILAL